MKTLLAITVSAIMLVTGGISAVSGGQQAQASVQNTSTSSSIQSGERASSTDIKKLPEYETLKANIDLSNYKPGITEDNANKRVILLKDDNGRNRYKSVYIKREKRLKIVDFQGGLIFNGYIKKETDTTTQTTKEAKASIPDTITKLPEYKTLADKADLSGYSAQIVEDNRGKRILLFKDASGQSKYKTIYVKSTSMVKIINL